MKAGVKIAAFLVAAATAASAPLLPGRNQTAAGDLHFAGWPLAYEGRALTEMPLTQREIAMRWVGVPTRRLHSAADCLRGIGYSITPLPARRDAGGHAMGCLRASHGADVMTVCELIRDARGAAFPDVSAWYWNALFGATQGPWWSFVVSEGQ
jgi:hypothetical protein